MLALGHPGTGAGLHVVEPALTAYASSLTDEYVRTTITTLAKRRKLLRDVLQDSVNTGARVESTVFPTLVFDATTPTAREWAARHAGEMVTDMTEQARATIRAVITSGFDRKLAPRTTAKLLRAVLPLTERDATAVMNRHLALLADGVKDSVAQAKAERYAAKLTRARADNIAITETATAQIEGQQQLWNQAIDKGMLDASAQKTVIVADPCPICAALDGETVPVRESFSLAGPPFHSRCQCSVGIV